MLSLVDFGLILPLAAVFVHQPLIQLLFWFHLIPFSICSLVAGCEQIGSSNWLYSKKFPKINVLIANTCGPGKTLAFFMICMSISDISFSEMGNCFLKKWVLPLLNKDWFLMSFWYCGDNMYNFIESLATISLILSLSLCFSSAKKKIVEKILLQWIFTFNKHFTCKYFKIRLTHVSVWHAQIKETYHLLLMESLVVHHHFSIVQYRNLQNRAMFFLLVQILPTDCIQMTILNNISMNT